jgi:glycosyltransferase involved in cell wall biosynthesis
MNREMIDKIKGRDCFAIRNNFIKYEKIKSNLVYGAHYDTPPFVTIIIPAYKRINLLWIAVKSALEQKKFTDYQILIVDDDDSADENEIIEKLEALQTDKIIYYKNEKNMGMEPNLNRTIELARSKWVCMLHDDDMLTQYHLQTMYDIVSKDDSIDHVGSSKIVMYGDGYYDAKYNQNIPKMSVKPFNIFTYNFGYDTEWLGAFTKKDFLLRIGGFDCEYSKVEDYYLSVKMAFHGKTIRCEIPTYIYRIYQNFSYGPLWQEQLAYEYHIFKAISKRRMPLFRPLFLYKCKYFILDKAAYMNNAEKNYLKASANVNIEELAKDCSIKIKRYQKLEKFNNYFCKIISGMNKLFLAVRFLFLKKKQQIPV